MLKIEKYTYESEENIKLLCSSFSCGNYVIDNFLKSEDCKNPQQYLYTSVVNKYTTSHNVYYVIF